MQLALDAYHDLFPDTDPYNFSVVYTNRFKPYNANVRKRGRDIEFNLSAKWKTVSREIQIGLMQELLCKILRVKKNTVNMDIYQHFMRSIHIAAPKIHSDPELLDSFNRNNEKFFSGMLELTNLKWGEESFRQLGLYEYGSDMITISSILRGQGELLDYVMYHEMLHKKLKFTSKNGRTRHHSTEFRKLEAQFPDATRLEKELSMLARKKRRMMSWF